MNSNLGKFSRVSEGQYLPAFYDQSAIPQGCRWPNSTGQLRSGSAVQKFFWGMPFDFSKGTIEGGFRIETGIEGQGKEGILLAIFLV